jgi:hypothetical protein
MQERAVGAAQCGVAGEPVEMVFSFGVREVLQQQSVPFREIAGPLAALAAGGLRLSQAPPEPRR